MPVNPTASEEQILSSLTHTGDYAGPILGFTLNYFFDPSENFDFLNEEDYNNFFALFGPEYIQATEKGIPVGPSIYGIPLLTANDLGKKGLSHMSENKITLEVWDKIKQRAETILNIFGRMNNPNPTKDLKKDLKDLKKKLKEYEKEEMKACEPPRNNVEYSIDLAGNTAVYEPSTANNDFNDNDFNDNDFNDIMNYLVPWKPRIFFEISDECRFESKYKAVNGLLNFAIVYGLQLSIYYGFYNPGGVYCRRDY